MGTLSQELAKEGHSIFPVPHLTHKTLTKWLTTLRPQLPPSRKSPLTVNPKLQLRKWQLQPPKTDLTGFTRRKPKRKPRRRTARPPSPRRKLSRRPPRLPRLLTRPLRGKLTSRQRTRPPRRSPS